jgi:hypothetical protein
MTMGYLDLPSVVYTPHRPEGFRRIDLCTWEDLKRAMDLRDEIAAATIADDVRFGVTIEMLRPIMAEHPSMTVAEAYMVIKAKADG